MLSDLGLLRKDLPSRSEGVSKKDRKVEKERKERGGGGEKGEKDNASRVVRWV